VAILQEEIKRRDPNFAKPLLVFEQQKERLGSAMISQAIRETFLGLVEADKAQRQPRTLIATLRWLEMRRLRRILRAFRQIPLSAMSRIFWPCSAAANSFRISGAMWRRARADQSVRQPHCFRAFHALDERLRSASQSGAFRIRDESFARKHSRRPADRCHEIRGCGEEGRHLSGDRSARLSGIFLAARFEFTMHPGNDVECVTAQVGAGANVVLFTTGLGTPTGNPICPCPSSYPRTRNLARRMPDIIDIDTGGIISGESSIEQMGEEILDRVIK